MKNNLLFLAALEACTPSGSKIDTDEITDTAASTDTGETADTDTALTDPFHDEAVACLSQFAYNYTDPSADFGLLMENPGEDASGCGPRRGESGLQITEGRYVWDAYMAGQAPTDDVQIYVQGLSQNEEGTLIYNPELLVTPDSVEPLTEEDMGLVGNYSKVHIEFDASVGGDPTKVLTVVNGDCSEIAPVYFVESCAGFARESDPSLYVDSDAELHQYSRYGVDWRFSE